MSWSSSTTRMLGAVSMTRLGTLGLPLREATLRAPPAHNCAKLVGWLGMRCGKVCYPGARTPMLPLLCSFALAQLTVASSALAGAPEEPRTIVREATRAVENDGAAELRARCQARLDRDPADRGALLGLATLSRLTYDYPDAEARYRRLSDPAPAPADGFATYARLGEAWALEERGFSNGAEAEFE